jgi:hypothetical protein
LYWYILHSYQILSTYTPLEMGFSDPVLQIRTLGLQVVEYLVQLTLETRAFLVGPLFLRI